MIFDSIEKAVRYIKESLSRFTTSGQTLRARMAEVDSLLKKAKAANDQNSVSKLIGMKAQTQALLNEYEEYVSKLGPFRRFFVSSPQLGVLPFWIIGGAGALASALYIFFEKVKNEGTALELIKKGMITPSEAKSLLGGGIASTLGNAGTLVMWGAIAYGIFVFSPMLKK